MRTLEPLIAMAIVLAGCSSTAGWETGAVRYDDRILRAVPPAEVAVYYKRGFELAESESDKLGLACDSTTLLRRSGLLEGGPEVPDGEDVEWIADLTTGEYPRDPEKSRLTGDSFCQVFGAGDDAFDLFECVPSPRSIERGVAKLKQMAGELGANEVRGVYYTGYAEHQMWEGTAIGVMPVFPSSPIYVDARLLELKLRDVRFHGTAVRVKKESVE